MKAEPRPGVTESVSESKAWAWAVLALAVVLAGVLLFTTRGGVGLSPDSLGYVQAAQGFAETGTVGYVQRDGSVEPLTQFPPAVSFALGAADLVGVGPRAAAWGLNAASLAGLLLAVAGLVRVGEGSWRLAFLAAALTACSVTLFNTYAMLWSEPLANTLIVAGFLCVALHLKRGTLLWLAAGGVLLGLATLTRYAAVAAVGGGLLAVLLAGRSGPGRRLGELGLLGVLGVGPFVLWGVRNRLLTGSSSGREITYHPPGNEKLTQAQATFAEWLLPADWLGELSYALLPLALLTGFVACCMACFYFSRGRSAVAAVVACYLASFVAFMLVSLTWVDAYTPLDFRILSSLRPLVPAVLVLGAAAMLARADRPAVMGTVLVVAAAAFAGLGAYRVGAFVARAPDDLLGYASAKYRESETVAWVAENVPRDAVIYSNAPDLCYLLTGRRATLLPKTFNPVSQTTYSPGRQRLAKTSMWFDLQRNEGWVIFFDKKRRRHVLNHVEFERSFQDEQKVTDLPDGHVYRLAPPPRDIEAIADDYARRLEASDRTPVAEGGPV